MDPTSTDFRNLIASAIREEVAPIVQAAVLRAVPEAIRRSRLPEYLNRHGLARETGWSLSKIDSMRRSGKLPHIKRGGTVLFKTSDVEAFLGEGYIPAEPPSSQTAT